MPRRSTPDPLAATVGQRIQALRHEKRITLAQLADRTSVSKGHLSSIENGFVLITLPTVIRIARGLNLKLVDLFTFPEQDGRQKLVDIMRRNASPSAIAALEQQLVRFCDAPKRNRRSRVM